MSDTEQLKLVMPLQRLLAEQGVEISPQSLVNILEGGEKEAHCDRCSLTLHGLCFSCFIKAVGDTLGYEDGILQRILRRNIEAGEEKEERD